MLYFPNLGPPVITQPQSHKEIPLKESSGVTLQCRAAGYGSLIYYWERRISENWITVDSENRTLYKTGTSGQYRCNVTNKAGSALSPVITVYGEDTCNISNQNNIV